MQYSTFSVNNDSHQHTGVSIKYLSFIYFVCRINYCMYFLTKTQKERSIHRYKGMLYT